MYLPGPHLQLSGPVNRPPSINAKARLSLAILALSAAQADAQVYRCTIDGKTTFTEHPAPGCTEQQLKVIQGDVQEAARAQEILKRMDAESAEREQRWHDEEQAKLRLVLANRRRAEQDRRDAVQEEQLRQQRVTNDILSSPRYIVPIR